MRKPIILLREKIAWYFITFVPIGVIFFIIPFELYFHARGDWNWDKTLPLGFTYVGILIYLVLVGIIEIYFRSRPSLVHRISISLFIVGFFILLADLYSPLQVGLMTGQKLQSSQPLAWSLLEISFLVVMIVIFKKVSPKSRMIFTLYVSSIITLTALVDIFLIMISSGPEAVSTEKRESSQDLEGNIYHIVLDGMQTDAALLYLEEKKAEQDFSGFTLFQNNVSNYLYTSSSVGSFLSGRTYDIKQNDYREWGRRYKTEGLIPTLAQNNYNIIIYYSGSEHLGGDYQSEGASLDDMYVLAGGSEKRTADFVRIWFARIMPNFFTNKALKIGEDLGRWMSSDGNHEENIPLTLEEGRYQFASVFMMQYLATIERFQPKNGQYLYVHLALPHGPYVMNDKCEYDVSLNKYNGDNYYRQCVCALKSVKNFLDELKRLDRYDNSLILIHGDHGGDLGFLKRKGSRIIAEAETLTSGDFFRDDLYHLTGGFFTENMTLGRLRALLMVKPPHSTQELVYSEKLSQLIDIYPTILDLLKLSHVGTVKPQGFSLFRENFPEDRSTRVFIESMREEGIVNPAPFLISNPKNISGSYLIPDFSIDNEMFANAVAIMGKSTVLDRQREFSHSSQRLAVDRPLLILNNNDLNLSFLLHPANQEKAWFRFNDSLSDIIEVIIETREGKRHRYKHPFWIPAYLPANESVEIIVKDIKDIAIADVVRILVAGPMIQTFQLNNVADLLLTQEKTSKRGEGLRANWIRLVEPIPLRVRPGEEIRLKTDVQNNGVSYWLSRRFTSLTEKDSTIGTVSLGICWAHGQANITDYKKAVLSEIGGDRIHLPHTVAPGEIVRLEGAIKAPTSLGRYSLFLDMVSEHVAWFGLVSDSFVERFEIIVEDEKRMASH